MSQMAIEEAGTRLSEIVKDSRVGEEIILTENDQPVARLMVISKDQLPHPRRGSMKGRVTYIAPDFDDTPEGFEEYTG